MNDVLINMIMQKKLAASECTVEALKKPVRNLESTDECSDFLRDMLHQSQKDEATQRKLNTLVMEHATCCIAVVSASGENLLVNQRAHDLLGYEDDELMQIGSQEVFADHLNQGIEQMLCRKDGTWVLVGMTVSMAQLNGGNVYIVVFNDITEKKAREKEMKALSSLPEENPQPVWRISLDHEILYMNSVAQEISESSKGILNHGLWKQSFLHVLDSKKNCEIEIEINHCWYKCMFAYTQHGYVNVYGTNVTNRINATIALHKAYAEMEGKVAQRTSELTASNEKLQTEIASHHQTEERLRQLSYQDELTGLGNRRRMFDRIGHAIDLAKRNNGSFAVFFLDLDHFKSINDTLGHHAGDELLKQVSYRLQSTVRTSDTVVRMGGDEFSILLENTQGEMEVFRVAETIINKFCEPFLLDDTMKHVYCSLGIALYPDHAINIEDLFKCADIALYKAKEVRNNYSTYNSLVDSKATYLNQLNQDLYDALKRKEFYLLYQPKVNLANGKIIGAEALIRWKHPKHGLISPMEFIPIAEGNGLMIPIGDWILEEACRTVKDWTDQGHADLCMAINLSPMQFVEQDLFDKVKCCMDQYDILPSQLEVEITETLTMDNPEQSLKNIQRFVDMGISIAIDDFGTGYSSLSRLKEMPIQTLKIDRSFIGDICHDHNDRVFVEMIINMGQLLGMTIVAEGIEEQEHVEFLKSLNCDIGQGYLFSPPVSLDKFMNLLNQGALQQPCGERACDYCSVKTCVAGKASSDFTAAIKHLV